MGKLHQLLAVEGDLDGIQKKVIAEAIVTFTKKPGHFQAFIKTLEMFDDNAPKSAPERQSMTTTVTDKLDYICEKVAAYYDAVAQKELTNQNARADLVLNDGTVLIKDLPATLLLGLESKLKTIRTVYEAIPTLAPGIEWVLDDKQGHGVYKTKYPEETFKTQNTIEHKILDKAHIEDGVGIPAQIKEWTETKNIGRYTKTVWSGMISPFQKSEILGRIDELIQATKKARQKANDTNIADIRIGNILFSYINAGK